VVNAQALDGIIGQWSCQFTAAACEAMLQAESIPAGRIFSVEDCATDPHFAERRAFEAVDVPGTGQVLHPGIVPQFDAAGAVPHIRWAGAELGAHNHEVYVGLLGLAGDELALLRERRIV
jgi:formyl-CoA transferase